MKTRNRRWVTIPLAACALSQVFGVCAQENPYYVGVAQGFTRQNNVFKAATGQTETNDTYSTTSLLAGLNQPISRQRIFVDGVARYNKYTDSSQLDNSGYGLDLGWDWETIEALSGRIAYSGKQTLALYGADQAPVLSTKNIEKSQEFLARAQYGQVSLLSLEGSYVHRQLDYSAVEYAAQEFQQDAVRLGVLYRPGGQLTLGIAVRRTEGKYPFAARLGPGVFLSDDFTRDDVDLTAVWIVTGQSTLRARLSNTRERHDLVTSRDLSGSTGAISWQFKPTAKLDFTTDFVRDSGAETAFAQSAGVNAAAVGNFGQLSNALKIRVGYELSAKVMVELSGRYIERDLINTQGGNLPATGSDRFGEAKLGVTWMPTRSIQLGCSAGYEKRGTTSALSYGYSADIASCTVQFKLN